MTRMEFGPEHVPAALAQLRTWIGEDVVMSIHEAPGPLMGCWVRGPLVVDEEVNGYATYVVSSGSARLAFQAGWVDTASRIYEYAIEDADDDAHWNRETSFYVGNKRGVLLARHVDRPATREEILDELGETDAVNVVRDAGRRDTV